MYNAPSTPLLELFLLPLDALGLRSPVLEHAPVPLLQERHQFSHFVVELLARLGPCLFVLLFHSAAVATVGGLGGGAGEQWRW